MNDNQEHSCQFRLLDFSHWLSLLMSLPLRLYFGPLFSSIVSDICCPHHLVFHSPKSQLGRKSPEEKNGADETSNIGSGLIRVAILPVRMDLSSVS